PQGPRELSALASCLKVSDLVVSDHFYVNVMGCLREAEGVWRCGDTLLIAGERGPVANIIGLRAPGFRYLTVQVWDCVAEHAGVLARVPYESFASVDRRLVFVCMNPEALTECCTAAHPSKGQGPKVDWDARRRRRWKLPLTSYGDSE